MLDPPGCRARWLVVKASSPEADSVVIEAAEEVAVVSAAVVAASAVATEVAVSLIINTNNYFSPWWQRWLRWPWWFQRQRLVISNFNNINQ